MAAALHGFLIGIANIIPGVSGGTMALMLGIYQRLLSAISQINGDFVKQFIGALRSGIKPTSDLLKARDIYWLISIALGAIVAIVITSSLITYMMSTWHDPTYGFFLGLVLFSIVVPYRMLKNRPTGLAYIIFFVVFALTIAVTTSMTAEEKSANALAKQELKVASQLNHTSMPQTDSLDSQSQVTLVQKYFPQSSFSKIIPMFLAGALAISAMILPGISGAFVLLLLGYYFEILEAIAQRDLVIIGAVGAGCIIGLLLFTKLLNIILAKFHDQTVMALIGLMLGSLFGLWPFQSFIVVGDKRIDLEPLMPVIDGNFYATVLSFIGAGVLVFVFLKLDRTNHP